MKTHLVFLVLIISYCRAQSVWIDNLKVSNKDFYPWITFVSESERTWLKMESKDGVQSFAIRIIVTTSAIYNTVYFEKVTFGVEGCCKKVEFVTEFDLQKFAREFSLEGELTGFHFLHWLDGNSFEFEIHKKKYVVRNISKSKVFVTNKGAG